MTSQKTSIKTLKPPIMSAPDMFLIYIRTFLFDLIYSGDESVNLKGLAF
jgi:hypothetical protein